MPDMSYLPDTRENIPSAVPEDKAKEPSQEPIQSKFDPAAYVELMDELNRLRKENHRLRAELSGLRRAVTGCYVQLRSLWASIGGQTETSGRPVENPVETVENIRQKGEPTRWARSRSRKRSTLPSGN